MSKKKLQFSRCEFKTGDELGSRHEINVNRGYWKEPNCSANKPPRWLYQIEPTELGWKAFNPAEGALNLGAINTAQEDKAGVVFRLLPLVRKGKGGYIRDDSLEVRALFIFNGPAPRGSSAEPFTFDPGDGTMRYMDSDLPYLLACLLGVRPPKHEVEISMNGTSLKLSYDDAINALAADITVAPQGGTAGQIPIFDLSEETDFETLKKEVSDAWEMADPAPIPSAATAVTNIKVEDEELTGDDVTVDPTSMYIPELTDLLGIDPAVYRQINAAIASGKSHLMVTAQVVSCLSIWQA